MDSDKPSGPSSKSGSGDDLIEEMAKLMGNPGPKAESAPVVNSEPETPASRPTPEAPSQVAPDLGATPVEHQAPEPVSIPRSTPAPTVSADDAPGWLPKRHVAPQPEPTPEPTPAPTENLSVQADRQEPRFSLRPAREEPQPPVEAAAPEAAAAPVEPAAPTPETTGAGWKPELRPQPEPPRAEYQLPRETPRTPEPEMPQIAPETPASTDFDFGFAAERPAAHPAPTPMSDAPVAAQRPPMDAPAEVDPIADLIRHQLQSPAAEPAAPAPSGPQEPQAPVDNFNVPPVFGLGGDTSTRSMSGSDALDDIENLIGNAVRVDLPPQGEAAPRAPETPATPAPVPQPAVRPHQPRPEQHHQSSGANVDAAEAAILAALATNSARADDRQAHQSDFASASTTEFESSSGDHVLTDNDQPSSGIRWRRLLMPIAALVVLAAIGFGGYAFLTATPPEGEAPVLVADSDPNKVTPAVDESTTVGDSIVFNGDAVSDGSQEQLVSRDQSNTTGEDAIRQIITADTTENGLANRRVRTVTVRPDGTIVRGDDMVAGSEALPVDRPEVPALPADAVTSALADTQVTGLALTENTGNHLTDLVANTPANLVAVNGDSVPFPAARPNNLNSLRSSVPARITPLVVTQPEVTAVPQPQVVEQPAAVDLLGALDGVTPPPATANEAAPSVVDPPPQVVTAAAWVQLASQRDQAVANSEAGRLSRLYSSALGGRQPVVQQADLADRGIWYRVLVPAGSLSEAQSVCTQITNIGGDCFARAN